MAAVRAACKTSGTFAFQFAVLPIICGPEGCVEMKGASSGASSGSSFGLLNRTSSKSFLAPVWGSSGIYEGPGRSGMLSHIEAISSF